MNSVFNKTLGSVGINNEPEENVRYYANDISVVSLGQSHTATLGTNSGPTSLVDNAETKIFTFVNINLQNITTSTLTEVTYNNTSINVNIY